MKTRDIVCVLFFPERSRFNIYSLLAARNDDDDTFCACETSKEFEFREKKTNEITICMTKIVH